MARTHSRNYRSDERKNIQAAISRSADPDIFDNVSLLAQRVSYIYILYMCHLTYNNILKFREIFTNGISHSLAVLVYQASERQQSPRLHRAISRSLRSSIVA